MNTKYTMSGGNLYKHTDNGEPLLMATGISEQYAAEIIAAMNAYKPPTQPTIQRVSIVSEIPVDGTPFLLGETIVGLFELLSRNYLPTGFRFAKLQKGIESASKFWNSLTDEDKQEVEAGISAARTIEKKSETLSAALKQLRNDAAY